MGAQIQLLGVPSFRVVGGGQRNQLGQAGQRLCNFLLYFPDRTFRLEFLRELFWENVEDTRARGSINTVLWRFRKMLSLDELSDHPFAVRRGDIVLDATGQLSVDTRVFEQAAYTALGLGCNIQSEIDALSNSAALYRGPLLDNEVSDWAVKERDRLQELFVRVLSRLANRYIVCGKVDDAICTANEIIRVEPLREAVYRDLIILLALTEQRANAFRLFDRLRRALCDDLGISPSRDLVTLVESLRTEGFREKLVQFLPECFLPRTRGISFN